jgi:hypothetical protein
MKFNGGGFFFFFYYAKKLRLGSIQFILYGLIFFFTLFRECFKFGNRIIKISKIFLGESKFKFEFLRSNMFQ